MTAQYNLYSFRDPNQRRADYPPREDLNFRSRRRAINVLDRAHTRGAMIDIGP